MIGVRLCIFFILIQICFCTVDHIFDEWAIKKQEPSRGYGPYKLTLLQTDDCNTFHKKDPDSWINVTSNIEKYNDSYNIKVDMFYPVNIRCIKVNYEVWVKIDKKIRLATRSAVNNPCDNLKTFIFFKYLNTTHSCTIMKGNYHFIIEDVDKLMHNILKSNTYARFVMKIEFFSQKGQFSCHFSVGDFEKSD